MVCNEVFFPGFSSDPSHLVLDAVRTKDFIVKHPSNKIKHDENNNRKSSGRSHPYQLFSIFLLIS